ncbi:hypothetical protein PN499_22205 [Kamptonema animale CS-326]|uniref:hypothetical protein n=1 Tax=Kamptonema animale TaxID=92934 RepID=UPI00232EEE11|nr:hypothetical protein [Kamptonema animale]MDB9513917.1 hypothetical protein [Kamptonema animale CS-326]
MTIIIKHIKDSKDLFDTHIREGTFFKKINSQFVLMLDKEQREFISTNFAVGYIGSDYKLNSWARKTARGLTILSLDGKTISEKRTILWKEVNENKIQPILQFLIKQSKAGKTITLWYLSKYDIETAQLIKRFIDWYTANC